MRRRPSASTTDEEDDCPESDAPTFTPEPQEKTKTKTKKPADGLDDPKSASKYLHPKPKRKNSRPADASRAAWKQSQTSPAADGKEMLELRLSTRDLNPEHPTDLKTMTRRSRLRNPWAFSWLTLGSLAAAVLLLLCLVQSFTTRQLDPKGGSMSFMASSFVRFNDFDTEHTRFATKYSLHMYRELGVDEDPRVKGVPVLFIPGNAGSYKQVRSLAAEAEYYFARNILNDNDALQEGKRGLDFFTVDFNEDFTAFHGQTLLDQAEYLNDAISYILALYHNPERSRRDSGLPDPSSVILVGHSMGGVVARTMLTMSNYQTNSVNTIVTLSAPHARPPVSFDSQIVRTYKTINDYWRRSHSKEWGMDNPLWHVTLISIAGGGLDTIVPSDYSSLASLVPETHGFTVFTSTIPSVWTGMDHLAITWCDEFRKTVIRALFDVLDVSRSAQTKPRGERMRVFKRWFLTGLEDVAEKNLPHTEPRTLLTLEDSSNSMLAQGERLVLRGMGHEGRKKAYLLPIPPQGSERRKFTLLTSVSVDSSGESDRLEVLFCSVFPLQAGHSASLFSMNMDLSGESTGSGSTRLACKNAAEDIVILPASTKASQHPFDKNPPFSYLQYTLETLSEHQFVAVVDKSHSPSGDFVIAEFSTNSEAQIISKIGARQLLGSTLLLTLPAERPLVMNLKMPALESSLLSYHLSLSPGTCGDADTLFQPLVRQYISDVYESKFFVNVQEADVNVHGIAPYMPPSLRAEDGRDGLSFQIWSDSTCQSSIQLSLSLDVLGSFGKLWMRYRTIFASFPLLIVALVMSKQFKVYDESGIFMSFAESLNQCLRRDVPISFTVLVFFTMYLSGSGQSGASDKPHWYDQYKGNSTEAMSDYTMNNLLIGSPDPFFWFLVPLFGIISTGLCAVINYLVLAVTHGLAFLYSRVGFFCSRIEESRRSPNASFAITSIRQRIITTGFLLALVATVLPYQFAYVVLCIVQIVTCIRALRLLSETRSDFTYNFYNYCHSILILMIWILPINLPVLVVWIRNLALHWLTPFSSHHNILSIVPFILIVETGATGTMVPRLQSRIRYVTASILFLLAFYAAIYGVSYAYALHQVADLFCGWLVVVLWFTGSWELDKVLGTATASNDDGRSKKRP